MILSGRIIQKLIEEGKIFVEPKPKVKKASIKIHLSGQFSKNRNFFKFKEKVTLRPKEFVLALTLEKIRLPKTYAGLYDGYIGLSSQGITTHMGSMFVDPGFSGQIVLEIFNASTKPIILEKKMRVGHLLIIEVKDNL